MESTAASHATPHSPVDALSVGEHEGRGSALGNSAPRSQRRCRHYCVRIIFKALICHAHRRWFLIVSARGKRERGGARSALEEIEISWSVVRLVVETLRLKQTNETRSAWYLLLRLEVI